MIRHLLAIAALLAGTLVVGAARAASVIGCGETIELVTQRTDEIERAVFDANAGEVVSITVAAAAGQDTNFNPEFFLEDPNGDRVFFGDGSSLCAAAVHQCETQPLLDTGSYTINARDAGRNRKGVLFLTLEAVSATAGGLSNGPGDGPVCRRVTLAGKADGTQPVAVGAPAGGTIDGPGETDTFTFRADAGQVVTIQLAPVLPAAGGFDPRAALFDPAGQLVGDVCLAGELCTFPPLAAAGVHTVKVFDIDYAGAGDYTLLVDAPAPPTSTTTTTVTQPTITTTTMTSGSTSTSTTMLPGPEYARSHTLRRERATGEELGRAIAADATRLVIGVPSDQTLGPASGRVYVVNLDEVPPQPPAYRAPVLATLEKPGGSSAADRFGASVALLDQGVIAVGAPRATVSPVAAAGAVFLYSPDGEVRPLTAFPQPRTDSEFGAVLAPQGNDLFVGAPRDGAGRVYRFSGLQPSQVFGAVESDPGLAVVGGIEAGARFGAAIAVFQSQTASLLAIGAPAGPEAAGRVYLLDRNTGDWQVLQRPGASNDDRFGSAVAFVDGTLVIGASGVGKVFRLQAGQVAELPNLPALASLGASLTPMAGKFLVGAPRAEPESAVLLVDLGGTESVRWSHEAGDEFGIALAAAGSRVVIASPSDDTGSVNGGAVFVYPENAAEPIAVLRKRESEAGFGSALAASDQVVTVGAPSDDRVGAVFAYRPAGCVDPDTCLPTWSLLGSEEGAGLGQSIALIGSVALIGGPFADGPGGIPNAGAALLAAVEGGQPPLTIPNPDPEPHEQFGFAVAAIETDLLVGLPGRGEETDRGEVRIFDSGTLKLQRKLAKPVRSSGDFFGAALAVEADAVAVGAPFDSTAAEKGGAVYLFQRSSAKLLDSTPLVSPLGMAREMFGAAVAMDPDWIVVGAPAPSSEPQVAGHAYVFSRQSRGFQCTIDDPRLEAGGSFGASIALVDGQVLVGAPLANDREPKAGIAHLFDPGTCAIRRSFQLPDAPLGGERFGAAVSAAGSSGLVIGAPGAGKVYMYAREDPPGVAAVLSMVREALVPSAIAAGPQCGNGLVDAGEVCDDGNAVDTDDCRNDCSGGFCCVIDPTAAQRCNDFDPCTTDSLDPVTNRCVNIDNGTCCMSDDACAGQEGVCRVCAGCALFPWDCCDQGGGAACILSSPECTGLECFDQPLCECQGGLTCDEAGSEPTAPMTDAFQQSCDALRLQADGPQGDDGLGQARSAVKASRRALRQTRNKTRQAYRDGTISKTCRGEYLDQIRRVRRSIPTKLRSCVRKQAAAG